MKRCYWLEHNYDVSLSQNKYTHCCKMLPVDFVNGREMTRNLQRIRKSVARGESPPECSWCWREESSGLTSFRQRYVNWIKPNQPTNLQFQIPSYCQGTCYYCVPQLSTSIARYGTWLDQSDLNSTVSVGVTNTTSTISLDQQLEILNHMPTDRPLNIGVVGGEPLLKDTVSDWLPTLLKAARERCASVNVIVCTNGWTKIPVLDEFYSLTDRLGVSVQMNISVENTEARAEWVRGMDWNHFERVVGIHKQRANEMVVKVTENFLCVSNLPEFVAWGTDAGFDRWDFGIVNQPQLQISVLPSSYKTYVKTALRGVDPRRRVLYKQLKAMLKLIGRNSEKYQGAIRSAELIDGIRGTDVHAAFPELKQHL